MIGVVSSGDSQKLFDAVQKCFGLALDVITNHGFHVLVTQTFPNCVNVSAVLAVEIHVRIAEKMFNLLLKC